MKIKKSDNAISQILASSLLLLMALAILSMVYMYYLSYPLPNPAPRVDIVGSIESREIIFTDLGHFEENCYVVLTHRGGELLPLDLEISMIIGNRTDHIILEDFVDSASEEDGFWGIGEQLVYHADNISLKKIEIVIIENVSDSLIFTGVLQMDSFVATMGTFDVQHNAATLCMDYDFKDYGSGRVRFAYKEKSEENWEYTPWIPRSGNNFYHRRVTGLSSITTYEYAGQLKYDDTVVTGMTKSFTTLD